MLGISPGSISPIMRNQSAIVPPIITYLYADIDYSFSTGYTPGNGPGASSNTFKIYAGGITGNITLTAPTNFQVSSDGATWSDSLVINYPGGDFVSASIYRTRLKSGLSLGTYNANATLSATGVSDYEIECDSYVAVAEFKITIKTDNAGGSSGNDQFTLPLKSGLTYNATIDWGDSTTTNQTDDVNPTHTYASPGTYQITISGSFPGINFFTGDATKLISIDNWGTQVWSYIYFYGCSNMVANYIDNPNLQNIPHLIYAFYSCSLFNGNLRNINAPSLTSMEGAFANCPLFNGKLGTWNIPSCTSFFDTWYQNFAFTGMGMQGWTTGAITTMQEAFYQCSVFNGSVDSFNVGSCTNFHFTFRECFLYNKPLTNWDTHSATTFNGLFYDCSVFNQPVDHFDVSNVTQFSGLFLRCRLFNQPLTSWDTSSATLMISMFEGASVFNQPVNHFVLDSVTNIDYMFFTAGAFNQPLSLWNVSSVTTMRGLFTTCLAFNQDISMWNISSVSTFDNDFLRSETTSMSFSPSNLSLIYANWSLLSVQPNLTIGFGDIQYTGSGSAGRAVLAGAPNNWTITDGGLAA